MKKIALSLLIIALIGAVLAVNSTMSWFSSRAETEAGNTGSSSISVQITPMDEEKIYLFPSGFYTAAGARSTTQSKTLGYTVKNTSKIKTIVQVNHAGVRFRNADNQNDSYTFRLYRLVDNFFVDSDISGKTLNREKLTQVGFVPYDLDKSSDMYEIAPLVFDALVPYGDGKKYATTPDIGLRMAPSFTTTTGVKFVPGKGAKGYNADFANVDFSATDSDFNASSNMYFYMEPGASIDVSFTFTLSEDWEALSLMGNTYQYSMITLDSSQGRAKNDAGKFVIHDLTAFAIEPIQESFKDTFGLMGDESIVANAFPLSDWENNNYNDIEFTKEHKKTDSPTPQTDDVTVEAKDLPNHLYTDLGHDTTESFVFTIKDYEKYDIDIESDGLVISRNENTIVIDHFQYTYEGSTATVKLLEKNSNTILLTIMVSKGLWATPTPTYDPYFFGGDYWESFNEILKANGGIYAAGYTGSNNFPGNGDKLIKQALLVKYSLDGDYLWHTNIASQTEGVFNDLDVLANRDIIAVGHHVLDQLEGYLVRFSPNGVPLWSKTVDLRNKLDLVSNSRLDFTHVKPTSDGGFLVAGYMTEAKTTAVIKYSSSGNMEHMAVLDYNENSGDTTEPTSILKNSDLNIISVKTKDKDYVLLLDSELNVEKELLLSGNSPEEISVNDMLIANDTELVLIGQTLPTELYMSIDGVQAKQLRDHANQTGFALKVRADTFEFLWDKALGVRDSQKKYLDTFSSATLSGTDLVIAGYTENYVDDWFGADTPPAVAPTPTPVPFPLSPIPPRSIFTITVDNNDGTIKSSHEYAGFKDLDASTINILYDNGYIIVGGRIRGDYNGVTNNSQGLRWNGFVLRLSQTGIDKIFANPKVSLLENRSYPYVFSE
ncbi:MAG: hypothetical protein LBC41_01190 [Clostridiales bacterium]|nr:hypothetical protein [Clostridiales bacterium]